MSKSVLKLLAFATLASAAVPAVNAQSSYPGDPPDTLPEDLHRYPSWEFLPDWSIRACDPSACFTYRYVGGDTWVITSVEPREPPGGRHEN